MNNLKNFENYIGIQAKASKKKQRKYHTAVEMEKRMKQKGSVDMDTIRIATGWFRNPFDNQWRFENDNYKLKIKEIKVGDDSYTYSYGRVTILLKNLIENTSIFKEYPQLKDIKVVLFRRISNLSRTETKELGSYNDTEKTITIRHITFLADYEIDMLKNNISVLQYKFEEPIIGTEDRTKESGIISAEEAEVRKQHISFDLGDAKFKLKKIQNGPAFILSESQSDTLLHEIQHAIQSIEGFALGSSPERYKPLQTATSTISQHDQYLMSAGEIEARDIAHRRSFHTHGGYYIYNSKYGETPLKYFKSMDDMSQYLNSIGDIVELNGIKMKKSELSSNFSPARKTKITKSSSISRDENGKLKRIKKDIKTEGPKPYTDGGDDIDPNDVNIRYN